MTRVTISPEARQDIEQADAWWQENRPAAPDLFALELAEALELLAVSPHAGPLDRLREFRRVGMRRSRYVIYYALDEEAGEVLLLRIWHMSRRPR